VLRIKSNSNSRQFTAPKSPPPSPCQPLPKKVKKQLPRAQGYLFFAATKIRGTKNKGACPTLAHHATLTT